MHVCSRMVRIMVRCMDVLTGWCHLSAACRYCLVPGLQPDLYKQHDMPESTNYKTLCLTDSTGASQAREHENDMAA